MVGMGGGGDERERERYYEEGWMFLTRTASESFSRLFVVNFISVIRTQVMDSLENLFSFSCARDLKILLF